MQLSEQYENGHSSSEVISYTTHLRCYSDLLISIVSIIAVAILIVGLLQVILKFCYHRDRVIKQQSIRMGINQSAKELRKSASDQDPYKTRSMEENFKRKAETRKCLKDATYMLKSSPRFYLFTFLLLLNLLNFSGEFFFFKIGTFLRIRAFIIVSSIMIF